VIHSSFVIVISAYLLANISYFLVLPRVITSTSTTIAVAFGQQVLGSLGALLFALVVSGSCFGALNATTFTTTRLYYAAAKEGYMPAVLGRLGLFETSAAARLLARRSATQTHTMLASMVARLCGEQETV